MLAISPAAGIAISVAGAGAGLGRLRRALPLTARPQRHACWRAIGFVFLVALAYAFTRVFSARGAFMQMGALIGTIMAANVLMVIIPGQRKVVADLIAGRTPDPVHGRRGKQRSTHNNYLTLPVVFVMISDHYPLAYATRWSWVILALLARDGRRDPPLLQHAPPGPAEPVVDVGRGGRRAGSRSCGSRRWGRPRATRPAASAPTRRRRAP